MVNTAKILTPEISWLIIKFVIKYYSPIIYNLLHLLWECTTQLSKIWGFDLDIFFLIWNNFRQCNHCPDDYWFFILHYPLLFAQTNTKIFSWVSIKSSMLYLSITNTVLIFIELFIKAHNTPQKFYTPKIFSLLGLQLTI